MTFLPTVSIERCFVVVRDADHGLYAGVRYVRDHTHTHVV